jgi:hypothetical protein
MLIQDREGPYTSGGLDGRTSPSRRREQNQFASLIQQDLRKWKPMFELRMLFLVSRNAFWFRCFNVHAPILLD